MMRLQEEVLSDTKALYFSPDGDKLAWIEFNDTDVDEMTITHYGQPGNLQFRDEKWRLMNYENGHEKSVLDYFVMCQDLFSLL